MIGKYLHDTKHRSLAVIDLGFRLYLDISIMRDCVEQQFCRFYYSSLLELKSSLTTALPTVRYHWNTPPQRNHGFHR